MKSFRSAFLIITMVMVTCNVPVEEWRCILNCNPNDCLVLDEEICECITDPICESEHFCGGDLDDCRCKEEDGGSWCTALTGDSIKTWTFAFAYDTIKNEIISDIWKYIWACLEGGKFRYQLDHIYGGWCTDSPRIYSWRFDNVHHPVKIIYGCIPTEDYPCIGQSEIERTIIKLNSDTLKLSWPYENEFKGWIAYVPYDD